MIWDPTKFTLGSPSDTMSRDSMDANLQAPALIHASRFGFEIRVNGLTRNSLE
jgi:hypothetical protein